MCVCILGGLQAGPVALVLVASVRAHRRVEEEEAAATNDAAAACAAVTNCQVYRVGCALQELVAVCSSSSDDGSAAVVVSPYALALSSHSLAVSEFRILVEMVLRSACL